LGKEKRGVSEAMSLLLRFTNGRFGGFGEAAGRVLSLPSTNESQILSKREGEREQNITTRSQKEGIRTTLEASRLGRKRHQKM